MERALVAPFFAKAEMAAPGIQVLKVAWHTKQDNDHSAKQWGRVARAERFEAAFLLSRTEESSQASAL